MRTLIALTVICVMAFACVNANAFELKSFIADTANLHNSADQAKLADAQAKLQELENQLKAEREKGVLGKMKESISGAAGVVKDTTKTQVVDRVKRLGSAW